jgi:quercetin 2,3-dioxygenase
LYFREKLYIDSMSTVKNIRPLGFQWETRDPFLFCAHHCDDYPKGNEEFGPAASLSGRNIGQDFTVKDGWRMYHGHKVPGFPSHPHRGFETVTIVLEGFVDHSDSHGAAGRYGNGDVQWMTAGSGLQHAEMFPLLKKEEANPAELFQVWLNLPASGKFSEPYYKMLWSEEIPVVTQTDNNGKTFEIRMIAGKIGTTEALPPAPDSWAADPENEVAIWLVKMEPGAEWSLPPANKPVSRMLYFYEGISMMAGQEKIPGYHSCELDPGEEILLANGKFEGRLLILQGKPINEPVMQYGPFVMNTEEEIREAFRDFRATQFGGWPWDRSDPVHGPEMIRFARYSNGETEYK